MVNSSNVADGFAEFGSVVLLTDIPSPELPKYHRAAAASARVTGFG